MTQQTYYQLLGVEQQASAEDIRTAFKKVVLTKHPDHGGREEDFIEVQTAYEVLIDPRKRRVYDRFGTEGLEKSAETLFAESFRGGAFAPDQPHRDLQDEVENLRRENESLQRQLMIVKPEEENTYAKSFESWLRNRDPNQLRIVTSDTLVEEMGVSVEGYEPSALPALDSVRFEQFNVGEPAVALAKQEHKVASELRWGEVLLQTLAAAVGPVDRHLAYWGYIPGYERPELPFTAGADGVAMVVAVGPGVRHLKVHDLVQPRSPFGGMWSSFSVARETGLRLLPPTSAKPDLLACFNAFSTAYWLLERFGSLRPGDTIIQSQADTAVGQAVIQLAKALHLKTINLVDEHEDFDLTADVLNGLGATHVWKNSGSILTRLQKLGASRPRLAIDGQGGATLGRLLDTLRRGTAMVAYGAESPKIETFPYRQLMYEDIELRGFWLYGWLDEAEKHFVQVVDLLLPMIEDGKLRLDHTAVDARSVQTGALLSRQPGQNVVLDFATVDQAKETAARLG